VTSVAQIVHQLSDAFHEQIFFVPVVQVECRSPQVCALGDLHRSSPRQILFQDQGEKASRNRRRVRRRAGLLSFLPGRFWTLQEIVQ
jgi:hypothetical protein